MDHSKIKTFAQLKNSGYKGKSIKKNFGKISSTRLRNKQTVFEGIWGYEETVIPDLERAILAGHDINLLGLRGQAKTRLARLMVNLLDEYIPVIEGSELNDDPFSPTSRYGRDKLKKWVTPLHRPGFTEKTGILKNWQHRMFPLPT
jgi:magnesium chelatase subunit I